MRLFRHFDSVPPDARGAVLALGNFDGVHRGHQAVIAEAGRIAERLGAATGVVTFEPHPRSVFRPDDPPFRLTPLRAKAHQLEALGVQLMVSLHFDRAFAARTAENFVSEVLHQSLAPRHIVSGYDFVFGQGRKGDAALLEKMGAKLGFGVTIVAPVAAGSGAVFSSTSIREHLQAGEPRQAAELLGRFWEIEGRVEHGDARGRTIGFPTANVGLSDYLRPAPGVYAVRAGIERPDGVVWHGAIANLGMRPTVNGTDLRLEAHLLDFAGDLYGQHLRVAFVDRIRPEQKFAGLDALKVQIARDVETARAIHKIENES
ncbi:MAG TPA: bifunctional riboflavin kinase/FAD synthetase [Aliidongia sp.]|nr:bifunctional riboflavin kinase/FAD synthetase [Aliidongia sp.]